MAVIDIKRFYEQASQWTFQLANIKEVCILLTSQLGNIGVFVDSLWLSIPTYRLNVPERRITDEFTNAQSTDTPD